MRAAHFEERHAQAAASLPRPGGVSTREKEKGLTKAVKPSIIITKEHR